MKEFINYIVDFFTKHDLEYYPKYMKAITDNAVLEHKIEILNKIINNQQADADNFELKENYYKNELFTQRSTLNKELIKQSKQLSIKEIQITQMTNRIAKLERLPQKLGDIAIIKR